MRSPIHASARRAANSLYDWSRRFSVVPRARRGAFWPANLARGIAAFVGCLAAGLFFSSFLQSGFMRRQISRLGLDKNLIAILTAAVGLVVFLAFLVLGLNLGGLPIPWEAKVPAIGLSLSQIFQ
jgi:uncharacterized membrane protein YhaH (DUF805 family)